MKQISILSLIIFISLFLTGCPYEAPFAIDSEPQVAIDTMLLGKWVASKKAGEEKPLKLEVLPFNDKEYAVILENLDGMPPIHSKAFLSNVNGVQLLNFNLDLRDDEPMYIYFVFQKKGEDLYLAWLREQDVNDMHFKSSKALRNFLEKNINGPIDDYEVNLHLIRPESK